MIEQDSGLAEAGDSEGVSALRQARYRGRIDMVQAILAARPTLDVFDAATAGDEARLAELLQASPSLCTDFSSDGFTALHFACYFAQVGCARMLLSAGADPNAVSRNVMHVSPLHSASSAGQADICRMLIGHGADVNARQARGWTALHAAGHNCDMALAAILLGAGADVTCRNDDGSTAAMLAGAKGCKELEGLLRPK